MTDPIADMLTRIRNASMVRKSEVLIPFSKLKFEIAKILKHEDYIADLEIVEDAVFPKMRIGLQYLDKEPRITHITRISKPGRRVYVKKDEIPTVLNGYGMAILSTPQGVMSSKDARRKNLGGEVLCEVW
jgi:small subunit ribosomal protein S8